MPLLHYKRAVWHTSIFGLKEVCADLRENDHHVNVHLRYMTACINIYSESETNVMSLKSKVSKEMGKKDLALVMANRLCYYN